MTAMVDLDKVLALIAAMNDEGVFFVRAEHENIERSKSAIRRVWDDPEVENITNDDLSGDYPVVRYGPADERIARLRAERQPK